MIKLKITGMTCGHCAQSVHKALETVPGVEHVLDVSLESGEATLEGAPDTDRLLEVVHEEGYDAEIAA